MAARGFSYVGKYDERVTIEEISSTVTPVLGWTPKQLVGRSAWELVHPDDIEHINTYWARRLDPNSTSHTRVGRFRFRHYDGHYVWCDITSTTFTVPGEDGVTRVMIHASVYKKRWREHPTAFIREDDQEDSVTRRLRSDSL